jgi:DNA polymerase III subunit gamma/tau
MSLATKYRPKSFEDGFIGQELVAEILKKNIEHKTFKNAMLFSGTSGCGKTTSARIVANLINNNKGSPIEIDAASNNGVDQVRNIIEESSKKSLVSEYKVFIIDECHMITKSGWNAYLKCIEECPKFTIFIFCTTNPTNIPETVLNRLQIFNFVPLTSDKIYNKLIDICKKEEFTNYEKVCDFISKTCKGEMRTAITNLEQVADFSKDLNLDVAKKLCGENNYQYFYYLTKALQENNSEEIVKNINDIYLEGIDLKTFIKNYANFLVDLSIYCIYHQINITSIPKYLDSKENPIISHLVKDKNSNYYIDLSNRVFDIYFKIKNEDVVKNLIISLLVGELFDRTN